MAEAKKKTVRIHLFKDNGRYKDDVFVGVNGVNYMIQRGVDVEVPPEAALRCAGGVFIKENLSVKA